ncbi:glycosyltransferase family protein [Lapidilactobacillus wuchangensis]|uniref:hypothetical protein n=1 Tax=Lapidilactobacillus wuchangensis TaxID=2486001 RepID=UPI000F76E013|nr:hypothetical protein [Lapidilactobacillus wuchangensis]
MVHRIKRYLSTSDVFNVIMIVLFVGLLFGISICQSTMTWRSDTYFHLSRIHDMTAYLKSLHMPLMVNIHSFANTGQAINGMYPNFSLLPLIFITSGLKPIAQYETIIFLFILLGSVLNYFIFQRFHASKLQALAAVFATFTFINIFYSSSLNLFGVWSIYFSLPMALLSLKKLFETNAWSYIISLAISVSFVLNTHLLNAVIMVGVLLVYFIYLWMSSNKKLLTLFKTVVAAVVSILLSLPTLVSVLSFSKVHLSSVHEFSLADGTLNIESMIHSLTNPTIFGAATPPIFGVLLVVDILLVMNLKQFSQHAKVVILIIFAGQFMISPFFPWELLQKTPISIIQFPTRLVPFILIIAVVIIFTDKGMNKTNFLLIVMLGSVGLTASYQTSNYITKRNFHNFSEVQATINMNNFNSIANYSENTKISNDTLLDHSFYRIYSYPEYIPQTKKNDSKSDKQINSVNDHELFVNKTKVNNFQTSYKNNKLVFTFNEKQTGWVNLPIWYYPNMNYSIIADSGVLTTRVSDRHTLEVKTPSTKQLTIKIRNPQIMNLVYISSIIIWCLSIGVLVTRIKFNTNRQ